MPFSYKPLWKQLIDKDMSKKELMVQIGISKSTMDKMGRGGTVSMEIIDKICLYFGCKIEDVIEFCKGDAESKNGRTQKKSCDR